MPSRIRKGKKKPQDEGASSSAEGAAGAQHAASLQQSTTRYNCAGDATSTATTVDTTTTAAPPPPPVDVNVHPLCRLPIIQRIQAYTATSPSRAIELMRVGDAWDECLRLYGAPVINASFPKSRFAFQRSFTELCRRCTDSSSSAAAAAAATTTSSESLLWVIEKVIDVWICERRQLPCALIKRISAEKGRVTCLEAAVQSQNIELVQMLCTRLCSRGGVDDRILLKAFHLITATWLSPEATIAANALLSACPRQFLRLRRNPPVHPQHRNQLRTATRNYWCWSQPHPKQCPLLTIVARDAQNPASVNIARMLISRGFHPSGLNHQCDRQKLFSCCPTSSSSSRSGGDYDHYHAGIQDQLRDASPLMMALAHSNYGVCVVLLEAHKYFGQHEARRDLVGDVKKKVDGDGGDDDDNDDNSDKRVQGNVGVAEKALPTMMIPRNVRDRALAFAKERNMSVEYIELLTKHGSGR